jgi:hypothetical protein
MNVVSMSKRFAATGAVAALAAAGLVGASTTAAHADPVVTNHYTCGIPGLAGPYDVTLVSNAVGIEGFPTIGAGFAIPGGLLTVTNNFTIPAEAYALFSNFSVDNVTFPDFAGDFGDGKVGVDGMSAKVSDMTDNGDGTRSFEADGVNAAFKAPAAGVYDIVSPSSFTMSANAADGSQIAPVPCTIATDTTPGSYHHITVTKNESTSSGKAAGTLTHKKASKLKVTVGAPNHTPTGKVTVKEGKKTLGTGTLKKGKSTVNLGKLKKGKHTVTVSYKGDSYTKSSKSKSIKLKVK